ncbi:MAG: RNA polymerase sigma factor [Crocinitomicaceae bacterium]|nr:RNA polymerase sigma factor [Crocinitomicaceae bacterium]
MDITHDIIKACMRDDRKAINLMYEYGFKMLMPICFRYNKNEEDARAAFNAGFIKILNGLEKVDEDLNFNAWAKRIMVNSLIDEYRKNKKYNTQITKSDSESELDFYSTGSSNDAVSNLGVENITALIGELPAVTGKVFNLFVIDGYAHKEIAEMLEMSEGTSKWHLSTARKMLRDKLEELENNNQRMVI